MRISELDLACPPMPPSSTTRCAAPRRRRRPPRTGPPGPAPTMTTSKACSSKSVGAPAASAISAFDGSLRARPSGRTISGSFTSGPASRETRAPRPSRPDRRRAGLRSARRPPSARRPCPTTDSPTMWTVCGTMRRSVAHSSRKLEMALVEHLVRRSRRLGDVVVDAPQGHRVEDRLGGRRVCPGRPRGTTSPRLACGWSCRARSSSSPPVASESDSPASTSATSSPALASSASARSARFGLAQALDPVVVGVALNELSRDVFEDDLVFVDDEKDGARHLVGTDPSGRSPGVARDAGYPRRTAGTFSCPTATPATRRLRGPRPGLRMRRVATRARR